MLRQPESRYEIGRSLTLLKVKTFHDAEARVLEHLKGAGRHKGRLGALLVELADGTQFSVGTGFSDAERGAPPPVGSVITFRYQEFSDGGVPRFPSYVGIRSEAAADQASPAVPERADEASPPAVARVPASMKARRFELVEGSASKFWEVARDGCSVTVRFGRIGSGGQTQTKDFPSDELATDHAAKLIKEKLAKGYRDSGEA